MLCTTDQTGAEAEGWGNSDDVTAAAGEAAGSAPPVQTYGGGYSWEQVHIL